MNKYFISTIMLQFVSIAMFAQTDKTRLVKPSDQHITYVGRINDSNPDRPTFTYPGTEIRTAFMGNSIAMKAKPHSGYFMVKIDENEPFKIGFLNDSIVTLCIEKNEHCRNINDCSNGNYCRNINDCRNRNYCSNINDCCNLNDCSKGNIEQCDKSNGIIASGDSGAYLNKDLNGNGKYAHQLTITYIGEGYHTRPEFHGFILNNNTFLTSPAPLPSRKIEFIGNSITCGYGIEAAEASAPYTEETANYYFTYAAKTARWLKAQAYVVARSGIGVYKNYNGPKTGDAVNMNTEYKYTMLYDDSQLWDFARFTPDVVCVNLGTNDTSTEGADSTLLAKGFNNLYKQIRSHYPDAKIIFLSGCMMKGNALKMAKDAMDTTMKYALSNGDTNVYRLDFETHDGSLGYGASWHPSMKQHDVMAKQLTSYLKSITKWE